VKRVIENPFAGPFFDPSDPALFNFDLSSMNFENRYGALEFGRVTGRPGSHMPKHAEFQSTVSVFKVHAREIEVEGRNPSLSSTVNQQPTPSTALSGDTSQSQNPFAGPVTGRPGSHMPKHAEFQSTVSVFEVHAR
jgi:hypothetical protein